MRCCWDKSHSDKLLHPEWHRHMQSARQMNRKAIINQHLQHLPRWYLGQHTKTNPACRKAVLVGRGNTPWTMPCHPRRLRRHPRVLGAPFLTKCGLLRNEGLCCCYHCRPLSLSGSARPCSPDWCQGNLRRDSTRQTHGRRNSFFNL